MQTKNHFTIKGNYEIASSLIQLNTKNVLDIGLGKGEASLFFNSHDKKVTSIGLDIYGYSDNIKELEELGINIIETSLENFNTEDKFDLIWASHILEHTMNVGLFLEKCHNLLSDNGYLCICVPPFKSEIVGGHITTGWTIGQLMYNLLLSNYNVKDGRFVSHRYNICAVVQKSNKTLPKLRMDEGDIETLKDFWPIDFKQMSEGDLSSINWFENTQFKLHKWQSYKDKIKKYENLKIKYQNLKNKIENLKNEFNRL